ncbi:MAG: hypothetical protein Q8M26_08945 [Pseudolabrys sp.]|nr:hypothetical protein [Pseudolabrys sp.]
MTRLNFTTDTQRQALARSKGICECHLIPHVFKVFCGLPLGNANTFFEHIDPDGLRKDNSLSNCAVLTRTCWKFKTHRFDQPVVARAKRISDKHNGVKDPWRQQLPGGRDSFLKKKINGRVVIRATGERA